MPTPDSDRPERGGRGSVYNSVGTSDRLFIREDAGEVEVVLLVSLSQTRCFEIIVGTTMRSCVVSSHDETIWLVFSLRRPTVQYVEECQDF